MAISRTKKETAVSQYVEDLSKSKGFILAEYSGLKVKEIEDIRRLVRPVGGKVQVVKNRLMVLALKEAGLSLPDEYLDGPTAIGFCYDEVPAVAKVLVDAIKDHPALKMKGGMVGTSVLAAHQVTAIADLPPREVLLAQVLGTIQAPATRIAGVVAGGIRQVVNVVQAYVDKLEESGAAQPAMEAAAEAA